MESASFCPMHCTAALILVRLGVGVASSTGSILVVLLEQADSASDRSASVSPVLPRERLLLFAVFKIHFLDINIAKNFQPAPGAEISLTSADIRAIKGTGWLLNVIHVKRVAIR